MGITHPDFVLDAFNPVMLNFIRGMKDYDYELIHYGHEESQVDCEHVTVVTSEQNRIKSFNGHIITEDSNLIDIFSKKTSEELHKRKKPNDIVMQCPKVKPVILQIKELIVFAPTIRQRIKST